MRWGFIGDKGHPRVRGYKVVTGDLDVSLGAVTAYLLRLREPTLPGLLVYVIRREGDLRIPLTHLELVDDLPSFEVKEH
jgi:hypothetical protein